MAAGKFQQDLLWNIGGLGVAGVSGVLLYFLIGDLYGAAALGVFNQVFAVYIFFSQFAVLGIHNSTLKYVAEFRTKPGDIGEILGSALVLTILWAGLISTVFWTLSGLAGDVLSSPDVAVGIRYATPGLFVFAINKVILGALNGMRHMRWFAVLQAGRLVFMLIGFGCCVAWGVGRAQLPVLLTVSELATLAVAIWPLAVHLGLTRLRPRRIWGARHGRFGTKSFLSGVVVELNTRVDILMLGYFSTDTVVGIYSFAAIFAEAFFQILVVVRNNYNPLLVEFLAGGQHAALHAAVRAGRNMTYLFMGAAGIAGTAAFVGVVPLITAHEELAASWPIFAILVAGIVASSGYVPFNQILMLAGLPGWHTIMS